jgi:plasmid stabilization system protein ParE
MSRRYRVLWAQAAEQDLSAIIQSVFEDDPANALTILKKIRAGASGLARFPGRGRVVPELGALGVTAYRELIIRPWRIVHRISEGKVYVLAAWDSRRNIEDLLLQRFIRLADKD